MKATQRLHYMRQSLWLDSITRGLLTSGTLRRYVQEFSITGLYVQALAAPFTINTMPEATLKALAGHGEIGQTLPARARYCDEVLAKFATAGIDTNALAAQLLDEGARAFVTSWNELLKCIASKSEALKKVS